MFIVLMAKDMLYGKIWQERLAVGGALARRFYELESFLPLPDEPKKLFRPMADLAKLFKN